MAGMPYPPKCVLWEDISARLVQQRLLHPLTFRAFRGRTPRTLTFCAFRAFCGRTPRTLTFCEFREFRGRTPRTLTFCEFRVFRGRTRTACILVPRLLKN